MEFTYAINCKFTYANLRNLHIQIKGIYIRENVTLAIQHYEITKYSPEMPHSEISPYIPNR